MALRLLELTVPTDQAPALRELLEAETPAGAWHEAMADGRLLARVLLDAEETGAVVDALEDRFGHVEGFQLLILEVEAALPRPGPAKPETPATPGGPDAAAPPKAVVRGISREELHQDFLDLTRLSPVFLVTAVLSTIVAAVGLMRGNVAVVIGAMVIAPFLGPNVALAFATTLGDVSLIRRSLLTNLVGVTLALAVTTALGAVLTVDPAVGEIAYRTSTHLSDIVLALAAGSVGALAITKGLSAALVGVMVAVALLPPTVVLGLMIGSGRWDLASGAGLLLAANVICVNLTGVVTFRVQGIGPRTWWEKDRARRSARIATTIWVVLLVALVGLMRLAETAS